MKPTYVLFGVDMETDVGSFTPFYEGAKHGTPLLLDLFRKKGVKGTFFFTGDCAAENPDIARMVAESGNEVGCHSLYHETVGDELFPIPGVKPLLPHEVKPRLAICKEWVEKAAGVETTSFRCPRLWGSTTVVNALEELGFTCDVSYPMYFYRERFSPYHPDRKDWTKKGDSTLVEIPNFADMVMESNDPGLERDRDQWPLFRTKGAEYILEKSVAFMKFCDDKEIPRVLAYYIHPWEFWPMKASYNFGEATVIPDEFITKNCGDVALRELGKLFDGLLGMGATFATARELTEIFS
ncbi:MAG: polysaccharide deacetylase family protein [Spirochaetales bacterium]|jgi:peptidoglycan/xylan/chitin deacetylase (PgdA/CDA1 family)